MKTILLTAAIIAEACIVSGCNGNMTREQYQALGNAMQGASQGYQYYAPRNQQCHSYTSGKNTSTHCF